MCARVSRAQWRQVADQLRPKVPKLAALMEEAEADVLAFMTFPKDHRPKIHSINPLKRLDGEIKRALMWSASSPTRRPSRASSVHCCSTER
jgi:transposase-like protein